LNKKQFFNEVINQYGNKFALLIILFVAAILRLWDLWDSPFMHDEFSALFRTRFDSFSHLIGEGVMRNDSHPAGVQVFLYYWVKLTGFNEFWVKLPFAISGIFSVWLIFAIGKSWFNETTGFISASFAAAMQFFVFYSQLARPYAPGLFFVLLAVYLLSEKLVKISRIDKKQLIFFSLSLSLAAYMQYFSLVLAGLIYLSGFFMIGKEKRWNYLLSGLIALVFYLPHFPVLWFQIKAGGIGGWLGAPEPDFILDFFYYTTHFSIVFAVLAFVIAIFLFTMKEISLFKNFIRNNAFLWFFLSFSIAYFYSVYRTPILQYSTLFFSFPFFMLVFFSFSKPLKAAHNIILVVVILFAGSFTLIFNRNHYDLMYHQGFDQTALMMSEDKKTYKEDIVFAAVGGSAEMFSFYIEQQPTGEVKLMNLKTNPAEFWEYLDESSVKYIGIAWADYAPYEWIESARSRFGKVLKHKSWFNSEYYLLEKVSDSDKRILMDNEHLLLYEEFTKSEIVFEKENVYGMLWEADGDTLIGASDNLVVVSVTATAIDTVRSAKLVLEFKTSEGDLLLWSGGHLHDKIVLPGERFRLHAAYRFDSGPIEIKNAILRNYIWNQANERFSIDERLIYSRSVDPVLLGLYAPLN
jgi:hypothetical protein